jgi:hypothetical protein
MTKTPPANQGKGGARRRRSGRKSKPKPIDMWRPVPPLADPEPIMPAADPTALVRSLGEPPLPGPGAMAELAIAAVIDRASGLAAALALSGDLLTPADEPDDEDDLDL